MGKTAILRKPYVEKLIPAYTREDALNFYHDERRKAFKLRLCKHLDEFDLKNSDFMKNLMRIDCPIENPDDFGKLWVAISDEQLEFEALEPFLKLDYFASYTLKQQLIVWKFVDQETWTNLLAEVSKERQRELLDAITNPFEENIEETPPT